MGISQDVIIREATEHDRDAIAKVMLEAYSQYSLVLSEPAWVEYRNSIRHSVYGDAPAARIIAEINKEVIGSVQLFLSSETAYGRPELGINSPIIRLLAVAPSARGRGIASLLIQEAARRSIELGADTLNLHTSDMMASAIHLYQKLGFQRAYETDIMNGETLVKGFILNLHLSPVLL
jgi:GNAT superfamily N-acetyltransferase